MRNMLKTIRTPAQIHFFRKAILTLMLLAVISVSVSHGVEVATDPATTKSKSSVTISRKNATGRLPRHRNLYNGDCNFLFGEAFVRDPEQPYTKENLHSFIDLLADSGIDTYIQNTNAQVPWYPSRRTPNILTGYKRGDREFVRGHFRPGLPPERLNPAMDSQVQFLNRFLDLQDAGVDWLAEISQACRRRGISPWISIRMNDMHGANSWEKSYMNCELQKDPKFRLNGLEVNPRDGVNRMRQSLDYAHQEVRDYMLLQIREAVEDYDYEGLELDWLRCPFCLNAPASQQETEMMTGWIREIRQLTQAKAKATGKPYPLGLRLPCNLGLLRSIGLDIKAMADEGLIDFVSFSNFWQTSWNEPLDDLRAELGDHVAIFGVIQDAPNWMPTLDPISKKHSFRLLNTSGELLRGNAAGKLALGADGIMQFNFFCTEAQKLSEPLAVRKARYAALRKLDELEHLRGQEKQYALASRLGLYDFPVWENASQVPVILEPGWKEAFKVPMIAEPTDAGLELIVQVVIERGEQTGDLGVSFNGAWPSFEGTETNELLFPAAELTHHVPEHRAWNFRCDIATIRDGWNEVLVLYDKRPTNKPDQKTVSPVKVVSVELGVLREKK